MADEDTSEPATEPTNEPQPTPLAEPAFDRMWPLVEAAQQNDARALQELLGLLSQPLLRAVYALLGRDHPDVDDLVQDVLIDVASALPAFRGECTLLHFAIRIAARKATMKRRRASSVRSFLERFVASEVAAATERAVAPAGRAGRWPAPPFV